MSNERGNDRGAFGDDSDDYVFIDSRQIILGLSGGTSASAVLPDPETAAAPARAPRQSQDRRLRDRTPSSA